ncbi:MAG: hypothetical protein M1819_000919 [Sarea resinae]|nr:MAG: hypothetical protein M1819_000919 [Sarea resinae]
MTPMGMEQEQQHGQDNDFGNGQWVEISAYNPQHQSPVNEYNGFGFMAPHSMPMEPTYSLNRMSQPSTHQQPHPLIMPQWPSMLTSQSSFPAPLAPIMPNSSQVPSPASATGTGTPQTPAPVPLPTSASIAATQSGPTPRRTLTDADRRRMCLYHEENPTVKQTEIGAMFGVERSTVSKVLRQKDKYLCPDDGSRSPIKRSKGKFPDIERALSNWARNHQRQGLLLTDSIIQEKARFFATTVGNSESHVKANSSSWLEKFKQKNNLTGVKSRKNSAGNTPDSTLNPDSGANTPNGVSPVSPTIMPSPSPISVTKSQDDFRTESPDNYIDFGHAYRHSNSQSTTSLSSVFTDPAHSPFSTDPISPNSPPPFFSPDSACGPSPMIPSAHARIPPASSNYSRPRSQTFPMLGIEPSYISPTPSSEPLTPKYMHNPTAGAAPPALESPISEMPPPLNINEALRSSPLLPTQNQNNTSASTTNHSSPSSMQPPPTLSCLSTQQHSSPTSSTGLGSSPTSPTQDEARHALEVLMKFFQQQPSGLVDPTEYVIMGKMMEKLKLQGNSLPGGLHQIPEQEVVMGGSGGGGGAGKMEHSMSAGL